MTDIKTAAIFASMLGSIFVAFSLCFLSMMLSVDKASQEKARARRLVDAKMNARLLRFNI
jgi:hypothetical protein